MEGCVISIYFFAIEIIYHVFGSLIYSAKRAKVAWIHSCIVPLRKMRDFKTYQDFFVTEDIQIWIMQVLIQEKLRNYGTIRTHGSKMGTRKKFKSWLKFFDNFSVEFIKYKIFKEIVDVIQLQII